MVSFYPYRGPRQSACDLLSNVTVRPHRSRRVDGPLRRIPLGNGGQTQFERGLGYSCRPDRHHNGQHILWRLQIPDRHDSDLLPSWSQVRCNFGCTILRQSTHLCAAQLVFNGNEKNSHIYKQGIFVIVLESGSSIMSSTLFW